MSGIDLYLERKGSMVRRSYKSSLLVHCLEGTVKRMSREGTRLQSPTSAITYTSVSTIYSEFNDDGNNNGQYAPDSVISK